MEAQKKVLVVDDDPDEVQAMKVVLEERGYVVQDARNGEEGLERARREMPDLVILDVMMTRGDEGFDVCRTLKADRDLKSIPVILLTALKERTGFDFKPQAGNEEWLPADEYLDKPVKPEELLAKVKRLTRG